MKQKKPIVFNEKVIRDNQKKLKVLRKLINKTVSVVDKNYSCRNLKNCVKRNLKNMKPLIDDFDSTLNQSLSSSTSKRQSFNSTNDLYLSKKRKKSVTNKYKRSKEAKLSEQSVSNASRSTTSLNGENNSDSDSESNDAKTRLIQKLIKEQKKLLEIEIENSDSDDSELDEKEFLNDREYRGKGTLWKIKRLRSLPDYQKIKRILYAPQQTPSQKRKSFSLNSVLVGKHSRTEHWSTYNYLVNRIEQCFLKFDWNKLTNLLVLLADAPKSLRPFFLKVTLMNLICNPATRYDESMFENFLKSCFSCQSKEDMEKVLTGIFRIPDPDDFERVKSEDEEIED